jgi:saccharopine dehydrogenase-like NADP-dependent oxidoreductase
VGPLDAFFTDGARTLFRTVGPLREMWEKTLRYPGHVDAIRSMRELGLFDETPVDVDGAKVVPRRLTAWLLEEHLRAPGSEDLLAMKVDVKGLKGGRETTFTYTLLDLFDGITQTSAMARTTAFTASVVAQMLAQGEIEGRGVITPEEVGMRPIPFKHLMKGLRGRGVVVS